MLSGLDNPLHLLILALVVLMLFGAKRVPDMGRALGSGMREFKDGVLGRDATVPGHGALETPAEVADRARPGTPAA
ncbi:MAG TPA: twin-arginine translocase TatA/TatE family subunit [Solirubrobacteraceae bacterium]|nr:twin-arginine translocase TatA/TatE family subunit [Solirubrobacteraceae bacterium]